MRALMRWIVASSLALASLACARPSSTPEVRESGPPAVAASAERHTARGVIKQIPADRAYLSIEHEAIPGYMAAMTMDFEPATRKTFDGLAVGDAITFTFATTDDGRMIIESVQRVPATK